MRMPVSAATPARRRPSFCQHEIAVPDRGVGDGRKIKRRLEVGEAVLPPVKERPDGDLGPMDRDDPPGDSDEQPGERPEAGVVRGPRQVQAVQHLPAIPQSRKSSRALGADQRSNPVLLDALHTSHSTVLGLSLKSGMTQQKRLGQFFTPLEIAAALVRWVIRVRTDRLLDPSCGDGRFILHHRRSVGVELDPVNAAAARTRAPWALVHGGDFFAWATQTRERFEGIAGNPPFIRYQNFTGDIRAGALASASMLGAEFSALTSSWAPFLVVAAGLLQPGGRMAFVVPAEIGHAGYSRTLLPALCRMFNGVHIVACCEKLFPELSEDCWLLHCEGYGGQTDTIGLSVVERFAPASTPPRVTRRVPLAEWTAAGGRLRPFLLPRRILDLYSALVESPHVQRFSEVATANIGYVSGANDFFHLRPSEAQRRNIPNECLRVAVRKSGQLPHDAVDQPTVRRWIDGDEPVLLLDLKGVSNLPESVQHYLNEQSGQAARETYKCRNRAPWYVVPDVKVPDAFLSVMSGEKPLLVRNEQRCVCTNSLHAVTLKGGHTVQGLQRAWNSPLALLGGELEGHPLGGGMLKLEPREAARVPVPIAALELNAAERGTLEEGVTTMRHWRHYDR